MTKLTPAQTQLLISIGGAATGAYDAPEGAKAVIGALIKRGFVISMPVADGPSRLLITEAGRAAIDTGPGEDVHSKSAVASARSPTAGEDGATDTSAASVKGRIGALLALLRRPEGATTQAMMAATGWQAHSVRGALSGSIKKKLGLALSSEKTEAGRTYRIAAEADA